MQRTNILATALVLAASATLALVSPVQADTERGEFRPSDFGQPPPTPRGRLEITVAQVGRDLSFSFTQPAGYNAVHIRWGGPRHTEAEEEYLVGGTASQDTVWTYTIHHVYPLTRYVFKVQAVIKHDELFAKDTVGRWLTRYAITDEFRPPPEATPWPTETAPPPAPPPAPPAPPARTAPKIPLAVSAGRQSSTDTVISWFGDSNSDWYVVERRTSVAALYEGPGSTPWVAASDKLNTTRFVAHYPLLTGGLKNFYRVVAYNSQGGAASVPVAEHVSQTSVSAPGVLEGLSPSDLTQFNPGPDVCKDGYVWREAFRGDRVCVSPETRIQAAQDNRLAYSRRSTSNDRPLPDTCVDGFVWREASITDHVCVTPQTRAQTAADNANAASRRVSP
jgi:hypothetical protein